MRLLPIVVSFIFLFICLQGMCLGQSASRALGSELELALAAPQFVEETPVHKLTLDFFDAAYEDGIMVLHWTTLNEFNNARFEVERLIRTHENGDRPWTTLAFVTGNGTTDTLSAYAYYDKNDITGAAKVIYRLKQVSFDGSSQYSEPIEAILPAPKAYAVSSYPNPYTVSATIEYDIPKADRVRLTIYDDDGRQVDTLVNKRKPAGRYRVVFDAANQDPGLYMYRLEVGGRMWIEPMLLVK